MEYRALGLMSGSSMDGIDLALITSDGERILDYGPSLFIPYEAGEKELIYHAPQSSLLDLARLERKITQLHGEACLEFGFQYNIALSKEIDVIGFHGQTILHKPDEHITVQLGDGGLLAYITGCQVVNDFRRSDMAAGGEGAPLIPIFHQAIAKDLPKPIIIANIGGVSNISYIGEEDLLAADIGPGNALIDDYSKVYFSCDFDDKGEIARSGKINEQFVEEIIQDSFFHLRPPKSLDRFAFHQLVAGKLQKFSMEPRDIIASLTYLTARSFQAIIPHLPVSPKAIIIGGGGRKNDYLVSLLQQLLPIEVYQAEQYNLTGDFLEAQAFAFLAIRRLRNLPITFPSTTGCKSSVVGGAIYSNHEL